MRNCESGNCPDIYEYIYRIPASVENPSVERKSSALYALATPFQIAGRAGINEWLKYTADLKSKTAIFSLKALDLMRLQSTKKCLTGQY